ncbi:MAG: hypothetical protein WCV85_05620 [Patescibacteria group bacterium]
MKSIRIEPVGRDVVLIDIVCDCGNNCLTNEATQEASFKHECPIGIAPETHLICRCEKKFRVILQGTHIHVSNA